MLALNGNATRHGKPACAQCGGTGYVYLWSAAQSGKREWYCDRGGCKRSWPDADPIIDSVMTPGVAVEIMVSVAANLSSSRLSPPQTVLRSSSFSLALSALTFERSPNGATWIIDSNTPNPLGPARASELADHQSQPQKEGLLWPQHP